MKLFFRQIQNLDLIWHQDKYWKPSPRSTLQGSKLGLDIVDGIDEFFNKIWDTCHICSKTWIWNFFIYNQNFAFRSEISLWQYQKWKKHTQNVFLSCLYRWRILENFQHRVGFRQGQLGFWFHIWGQNSGWPWRKGTRYRKSAIFLYISHFEATKRFLEAPKTAGYS